MYVNVVFVIRCLYSAVSLTLVKEQRFIRIIIIIIIINKIDPNILYRDFKRHHAVVSTYILHRRCVNTIDTLPTRNLLRAILFLVDHTNENFDPPA